MWRWCVTASLSWTLAATPGQVLDAKLITREQVTSEEGGFSLPSLLRDIDGDGYNDLVMGQTSAFGQAGAIHVVLLDPNNDNWVKQTITLNQQQITGQSQSKIGQSFASSVTSIGDLDGNGYEDLVVACQQCRALSRATKQVDWNSPLLSSVDQGAWKMKTEEERDEACRTWDSEGQCTVDDSSTQALCRCDPADIPLGKLWVVFLGKMASIESSRLITQDELGFTYDKIGATVSNAGDVNLDGHDDLYVNSETSNGSGGTFVLFLGANGAPLKSAQFTSPGGNYILNGQGYCTDGTGQQQVSDLQSCAKLCDDDTLCKAFSVRDKQCMRSSECGTISLVDIGNTPTEWVTYQRGTGNEFGQYPRNAGDINQDGIPDLLVRGLGEGDFLEFVQTRLLSISGSTLLSKSFNQLSSVLFPSCDDVQCKKPQGGNFAQYNAEAVGDLDGDGVIDLLFPVQSTSQVVLVLVFLNKDGTIKDANRINSNVIYNNNYFSDSLTGPTLPWPQRLSFVRNIDNRFHPQVIAMGFKQEEFIIFSMQGTEKTGDVACYGNYECKSNICQKGKCLDDDGRYHKYMPNQKIILEWPPLGNEFVLESTVNFREVGVAQPIIMRENEFFLTVLPNGKISFSMDDKQGNSAISVVTKVLAPLYVWGQILVRFEDSVATVYLNGGVVGKSDPFLGERVTETNQNISVGFSTLSSVGMQGSIGQMLIDGQDVLKEPRYNPCFDNPCHFESCKANERGVGYTCLGVDKCANNNCFQDDLCHVLVNGTASCKGCPMGYVGNGYECVEYDGCKYASCVVGCVDQPPPSLGFKCMPCGKGFMGDGSSCIAIPQCTPHNNPCVDDGFQCISDPATQNTTNTPKCECGEGYTETGNGCKAIDSCEEARGGVVCPGGLKDCRSWKPPKVGYYCEDSSCAVGEVWVPNDVGGGGCVNYNACDAGYCDPLVDKCIDRDPPSKSATCGDCPSNYVKARGQICSLDLCPTFAETCYTPAHCVTDIDAPRGYVCGSCPDGMQGDGFFCDEIKQDTCDNNDCKPGWTCIAYPAPSVEYTCTTCERGFVNDPHTLECVEYDACLKNPCADDDRGRVCVDTPAPSMGYECLPCPEGSERDGAMCKPSNIDCTGNWSACTSACETASERTFTFNTTQSGSGSECPLATDCGNGDEACVIETCTKGSKVDQCKTCANDKCATCNDGAELADGACVKATTTTTTTTTTTPAPPPPTTTTTTVVKSQTTTTTTIVDTTTTKGATCETGFAVELCKSCEGAKCATCNEGGKLKDGACVKNATESCEKGSEIDKCKTCAAGTDCLTCNDGADLIDGACVKSKQKTTTTTTTQAPKDTTTVDTVIATAPPVVTATVNFPNEPGKGVTDEFCEIVADVSGEDVSRLECTKEPTPTRRALLEVSYTFIAVFANDTLAKTASKVQGSAFAKALKGELEQSNGFLDSTVEVSVEALVTGTTAKPNLGVPKKPADGDKGDSSDGLGIGALTGIIIGAFVLSGAAVCGVYLFVCKPKQDQKDIVKLQNTAGGNALSFEIEDPDVE